MWLHEKKPDFVNEEGTKWWLDKSLIDWADRGDFKLTDLGYRFWLIEFKTGNRTRLITRDDQVIYDNTSAEAIACRIDVLRLLAQDKNE